MAVKKCYLIVKQANGIIRKCRLVVNGIKRSLIITKN